MTPALSDDTLATVLLCGGLGAKSGGVSPLGLTEWNRLVRSLVRANWRPGDLLRWGVEAAREVLALDAEMAIRLGALLGQAVPIAAEIERLTTGGIRVLSRGDDAYPTRWRSRLREQSPPLLYVAGPVSMLERGGIAAVGSRSVDESGAAFARAAGRAAARAGVPVISGGARGVDREAMFGALDADGEAVGIMPDGISRALRSRDVRDAVARGRVTLASPHRPDSRFEVWKAMGRNKLIYALADVSVVVSSDAGSGGTWSGATENLGHDWSPLFVRAGPDAPEGNLRLIALGALPLDGDDLTATPAPDLLTSLLERAEREAVDRDGRPTQRPLLDESDIHSSPAKAPEVNARAHGSPVDPAQPVPGQLGFGDEL